MNKLTLEFGKVLGRSIQSTLPLLGKIFLATFFLLLTILALSAIKKGLIKLFKILRIDSLAEKLAISETLIKGKIKSSFSELIVEIFYWISLIGTFIITLYIIFGDKIVNTTVSVFDYYVADLSLSVFTAVFILLIGVVVSEFVSTLIRVMLTVLNVKYTEYIARFAKISILINATLRAMYTVGMVESMGLIIDVLVIAAISAIALSFAIKGASETKLKMAMVIDKSFPDIPKKTETVKEIPPKKKETKTVASKPAPKAAPKEKKEVAKKDIGANVGLITRDIISSEFLKEINKKKS